MGFLHCEFNPARILTTNNNPYFYCVKELRFMFLEYLKKIHSDNAGKNLAYSRTLPETEYHMKNSYISLIVQ